MLHGISDLGALEIPSEPAGFPHLGWPGGRYGAWSAALGRNEAPQCALLLPTQVPKGYASSHIAVKRRC